ncbi:MAG: hypothetical protein KBE23_06605 [Chloroflexi bacterium]|nr:hypothetical protein [Chloroflexota bacterium]MBP7042396.1 hypothetical protein [Chloroflexota bacterium]
MISTDGRPPLWERQPWDTNASYKAFKEFYLPAEEPGRLANAYREYRRQTGGKQAATKVPGNWSAWSRGRHPTSGDPIPGAATWPERAAAFDAHVAQEELKALAAAKARNKQQRMRVLEGALAQLTLVWSQLDYRPKLGPDGRLSQPELPSFRDATAGMKTILTELRTEYDDVPAQQVQVSGPDGRPLPMSGPAGYDFSDLNDDELLDRIREYESRRTGTVPGAADGTGAAGTGTDTDPVAGRPADGAADA